MTVVKQICCADSLNPAMSERRFPYTELTLATGMSVLSMTNLDSSVFVRQALACLAPLSWLRWPPVAVGHVALLHVDLLLLAL